MRTRACALLEWVAQIFPARNFANKPSGGRLYEADRSDREAVQVGRSERISDQSRYPRYDGRRSQRLWSAEGPHRALSRRGIFGGLFAESENPNPRARR